MSAVEWDKNVNKKVFGVEKSYKPNSVSVSFESGREIKHAKNTKCKRIYSVNISVSRKEEAAFDNWYSKVLGGDAGTFLFSSLELDGSVLEYRMTQPPQIEGQSRKKIKMEWEEG